jgi:hypothetical protein
MPRHQPVGATQRTFIDELLRSESVFLDFLWRIVRQGISRRGLDIVVPLRQTVRSRRKIWRMAGAYLVHSGFPLLQLDKPRVEELEVLYSDLLRRPGDLRSLVRLARPSPEGILEVVVDGVIALAFTLRQREDVEVELLAL